MGKNKTIDPSLSRRSEAVVGPEGADRADRFIAEYLGILSRSQIKARNATIEVNGRAAKLSRPLSPGDRIVVSWTDEPPPTLEAEDLALDIIYEDDRVIVVNKAQGMVTHPGAGNRRGTLANAVLGHIAGSPPNPAAAQRGGIVHRLDKDTSGVIIIAKDSETQAFLSAQFKDRTTRKEYLAITLGLPPGDSGRVENRLGRDRRDRKRFAEVMEGGRIAVTDWRLVARYGDFALLHLRPKTGRTHQLRVHLAGLGCPIVGDPIYGRNDKRLPDATLMLHAWKLAIRLPGHSQPSKFVTAVPKRFLVLLRALEKRYGR